MKPARSNTTLRRPWTRPWRLLGTLEDAKVLAGGQSLLPILALRLSRFEHLVDLGRRRRAAGHFGARTAPSPWAP